jgi:Fe-S cluster assembly iron-binding protein IscA
MSDLSETRQRFRTAVSGGGWWSRLFGSWGTSSLSADSCETAERPAELLRRGIIVWGAFAQANSTLFQRGDPNAPANVIWSADPTLDDSPGILVGIADEIFRLKHTTPQDPDLAEMARTITDELNNATAFEVPAKLTKGLGVWMTTTLVNRKCLPGGVIAGRYFPLLIDPDSPENNSVVPTKFWPAGLASRWRGAAADAPESDPAAEAKSREVKEAYLDVAREKADMGGVVRLTPSAAAELRRQAGSNPCVVEVRWAQTLSGFRLDFKLLGGPTPCALSWIADGIRIQIPDAMSTLLLEGTEIDYVNTPGKTGFTFHNPKIPGQE